MLLNNLFSPYQYTACESAIVICLLVCLLYLSITLLYKTLNCFLLVGVFGVSCNLVSKFSANLCALDKNSVLYVSINSFVPSFFLLILSISLLNLPFIKVESSPTFDILIISVPNSSVATLILLISSSVPDSSAF